MIHIRNAHEGETAVLASIGLRSWQQAMGAIGGTGELLESASEAFTNFTRNLWLTITVIELNGEAVGWAAREALDEAISDFWIDPDFVRRGLGSALLARIEEDVRGQGLEKVSLQSHAGNTDAIAFFRRAAMRSAGCRSSIPRSSTAMFLRSGFRNRWPMIATAPTARAYSTPAMPKALRRLANCSTSPKQKTASYKSFP